MTGTRRPAAVVACAALLAAACSSSTSGRSGASSVPIVPAPTTATATTTTASTTTVAATTTSSTTSPTAPGASTTPAPATTAPPVTPAPTTPPPTAPATPQLGSVAVKLTPVVAVTEPIFLATKPGDATLYVAERRGRIVAVANGAVGAVVLDIQGLTQAGGERGLLGFAFAPDATHLYVSYTNNDGSSVIDEYALGPDGSAVADSRRQVLFQRQPFANHNGGGIVFGPDGLLYFGLGDGGSGGDPQRNGLKLGTLLGKLLRFDPRETDGSPYAVPSDNPFVDTKGARPEIWAYGLRNPWRFSFDALTDDLWIGDVGQGLWEEVDHVAAAEGTGRGANFGWSAWEGNHRFNSDQSEADHTAPVHEYPHGALGCSITGGYVYRGSAVPALRGAYVFADYCAKGVRALDPAGAADATPILDGPANVVSFGQGPGNELYVLSFDGNVYRIDPA